MRGADTVGLLGIGHIAAALVAGWRLGDDGPRHLLLSPRNAETAARLTATYAGVEMAADNQAVLDRAETIILCLRPQVVEAALAPLRFTARHRIVSLVAALDLDRVAAMVAPARDIVRAVPMPFAAARRGPLAIFPHSAWASALLAPLGDVIAAPTAAAYDRFCSVTAMMSAYFRFLGTVTDWLAADGIPPDLAARYVAGQFDALSREPARVPTIDFDRLIAGFATKGGINEQLRRDLEAAGVFEALTGALDRVLDRVEGHQSLPSD